MSGFKVNDDSLTPHSQFRRYFRILFRWNQSAYQLIWKEFIFYVLIYVSISLIYDLILAQPANKAYKEDFEAVAAFCLRYTSSIPIILLLGFFTSTSMQRWFSLVNSMPGTNKVISTFILTLKEDPEGPQFVKHYSRWVILSWTLTFRMICKPLKKEYPTLDSLQKAGLLLPHEMHLLKHHSPEKFPLIVLDWNINLLKRCGKKGIFNITPDMNRNLDAIITFKKACGNTLKFTKKNIPFALIQAVTIAVYTYGVASIMARQLTDKNRAAWFMAEYFPILNSFQYFLYYLWLKFGRLASNPFGEDDDDINIIELLQHHIDGAARLQSHYSGLQVTEELVTASLQSPITWMKPKREEFIKADPPSKPQEKYRFLNNLF